MTVMVVIGRVFLGLAFLALVTAWVSEMRGGPVFGLSQQHLFGDATVMALLGYRSHGRRLLACLQPLAVAPGAAAEKRLGSAG